jgi:uncharacterized membrane protein (UPF0127 family)
VRRPAWLLLPLLLVAACGGSPPVSGRAEAPPPAAATPSLPTSQHLSDVVTARLGAVPLRLEVADDEQERDIGLMGRTEVPAGTGMLFRFPGPSRDRFYMFHVPVPLAAVFLSGGAVLDVVQMPPCALSDPRACPTYGPAQPYDAVVETAPATVAGVRAGDRLTLG